MINLLEEWIISYRVVFSSLPSEHLPSTSYIGLHSP
jgi:hypothetical protein